MVKKKSKLNKSSSKNKKLILSIAVVGIVILLAAVLIGELTESKVENGDTVVINYIGTLNDGTVFDTSVASVGLQFGLDRTTYEPFTFKVGENQVIPGFESNVLNLKVGEKKNFTLQPSEAYGEINQDLVVAGLNRSLQITRYSDVPLELFSNIFGGEVQVDKILTREDIPWELRIDSSNDTYVRIENLLVLGQEISVSGTEWKAKVSAVTDEVVTLYQNPQVGNSVSFPTPQGLLRGVVANVEEETYDVDTNHRLAGKTLNFEIEILEIKKPINNGGE
ncbi:FKBP-type peptidyl-prolyl cis-trans isomerase [Candidatus Woesearchaeota archaeon]|nr:FKBP-type peptidyl-prolyl cis-trans isomerase [Candidatus Woesearchaeota archaeon]